MTEHADAVPDTAETARQIAAAALAVPGVRGMHPGKFGEVATYVPGERVSGVRIGVGGGEVHIVTDLTRNLTSVAEEVRAAAETLAGVPFDVTVEDITVEDIAVEDNRIDHTRTEGGRNQPTGSLETEER